MAVTEQQRRNLHNHLEEILGAEDATVLMQHLYPGGYDQAASKGDIAALKGDVVALEQRLALRFEWIDRRFEWIDRRFDALEENIDHKIDARIERAQRELTVRLVMFMFTLLTMQTAVLGLLRAS